MRSEVPFGLQRFCCHYLMPHLRFDTNRFVQMREGFFTIGSDPACDLSLDARGILPRHLILQSRGDQWQVAKLTMKATIFVNEKPIDSLAILKNGDRIRIGEITFIWREENVEAKRASPWKGLMFIFLTVMVMLALIFLWFAYSMGFGLDSIAPPGYSRSHTQSAPSLLNGPHQPLTPERVDNMGHPIYRIVLPSSTQTPPPP